MVRGGWVLGMVVLGVAACGGPAGLRHRVERGENLYRIGKAYGVSHQELARRNGIRDPDRIEIGQVLVIPHATRELPVGVITPERARGDRPTGPEVPAGPSPFLWPVPSGVVSSDFGPRGQSHHDGIDISTAVGTQQRRVFGPAAQNIAQVYVADTCFTQGCRQRFAVVPGMVARKRMGAHIGQVRDAVLLQQADKATDAARAMTDGEKSRLHPAI